MCCGGVKTTRWEGRCKDEKSERSGAKKGEGRGVGWAKRGGAWLEYRRVG